MLMLIRLAIVAFLLITLISNVLAQEKHPRFEQLTIDDGLSSNTVNAILQDKQGYLWIATQEGLNRFDGHKFYIIKHIADNPNSLSNNYLTDIVVDNSNNIWIATNGGGVNRYDPSTEKITFFTKESPLQSKLSSNLINRVYVDKQSVVWVGTAGDGLNIINIAKNHTKTFLTDPNNPETISNNHISSILQDNKNYLWIGTSDGLNLFDKRTNKFKRYYHLDNVPTSISDNHITSIAENNQGIIWVCTQKGLSKYISSNDTFFNYPFPSLPDEMAGGIRSYQKISADTFGNIWITTTNGLLHFDTKTENFTTYFQNDPFNSNLNNNKISAIFFDLEKRMWVGTTDGGLNKYDPLDKRFFPIQTQQKNSKVTDSSVTSIIEDLSGVLWVATPSQINKYLPGKTTPELIDKFQFANIRAIFQDHSGLFWISAHKSLNIYDPQKNEIVNKNFLLPPELEKVSAICFLEDKNGDIWIGSFGQGLFKFNPSTKKFTLYEKEAKESHHQLLSNRIYSLCEDKKGNIWIGTANGLNVYNPSKDIFTTYLHNPSNPTSISSNFITSIYCDKFNNIWVGTREGLNKFDPSSSSFVRLTESNSNLPNNIIYGVLGDNEENIWVSSNKGIAKYDVKANQFYCFDKSDGLQSNEFNYYSYFKSKSGELFFGGINGFNRFYPDKIKNNLVPPTVVVSYLKISDKSLKPTIEKNYVLPSQELTLTYNLNYLFFTFSALNFTHPEKNKYKFRLEGHEQEWNYANSTESFARYSDLMPGTYTFHILAANNDGVWNQTGTSIKIRIYPPWWRTNWAYFLYFVTLSSVLYGGHRYHLRTLEKRNIELEAKVIERTEEINKKKVELETKNQELAKNYQELVLLNQKANRIFAALSEALPGTVLDNKYHLEEKIGSGGFGAVYKAINLTIKREVAIKVFSPSPGNDSVENLERFQQEAISTCRVNHPNAVAILDSGISSDGIPYLVMEMLKGHTLKTELRNNGRLSVERSAQIILPICKVLLKAHSTGLIHRDIKPDNIFLHNNEEGEVVKVLDFGIAKLINPTDSTQNHLTQTEGLIGTPLYMAPERLALRDYDSSSDVYSLGSVIYEMLCGQAPFQKHANILSMLAVAQLSEIPTPLKTYIPTLPDNIEKLVLATLEKDPNIRPSLIEIAQTFAKAAGMEFKTQRKSEENQINASSLEFIFNQPTLIVASKNKSVTDEISPSEQITLLTPSKNSLKN